jgi:hypothetical protein
MTTTSTRERTNNRTRSRFTLRDKQRAVHLLAGLVLLSYIYAASELGSGLTTLVRFLIVPAVGLSGIARWNGAASADSGTAPEQQIRAGRPRPAWSGCRPARRPGLVFRAGSG